MDNLLLSQGWRSFHCQEVLDKESLRLPFIPEYEGHLIQAVITDKTSGSSVRGINSYLSAAGKLVQFYASNSNEVQGISKEGKAGVQTVYFEVGEESL